MSDVNATAPRTRERDIETLIADAKRHMSWRQRVRFFLATDMKFWLWGILARIPGYRSMMCALYRIERQGLSGLWEPVFDISKQDFNSYVTRLKWHGWGVMPVPGGFRGYTPTSRTKLIYPKPHMAWIEVEDIYRGTRNRSAWESRP